MLPAWTELWTRCSAELADALSKLSPGCSSVLVYLYSRIGADAGACIRGLHNAGMSWGTYQDYLGSHCNAHANNLVVLPPDSLPSGDKRSQRLVSMF